MRRKLMTIILTLALTLSINVATFASAGPGIPGGPLQTTSAPIPLPLPIECCESLDG